MGQIAIKSAFLLGAARVIAIDRFEYRLRMAREQGGAETLNYEEVDVQEALKEMTGGRGPDACIDAVGMEAHYPGPLGAYDRVKQATRMETERPYVLRSAIQACRNGGTFLAGVYGGFADKVPVGSIMNRSLTIKTGQTHVQRYMRPTTAGAGAQGRDRSELRRHASGAAGRCPGGTDVPRQAGRMRQGHAAAERSFRMSSLVPKIALPGRSRSMHDEMAAGLGYFSIALGLTELAMPQAIRRAAGIETPDALVRGYGVREIANGVAILMTHMRPRGSGGGSPATRSTSRLLLSRLRTGAAALVKSLGRSASCSPSRRSICSALPASTRKKADARRRTPTTATAAASRRGSRRRMARRATSRPRAIFAGRKRCDRRRRKARAIRPRRRANG